MKMGRCMLYATDASCASFISLIILSALLSQASMPPRQNSTRLRSSSRASPSPMNTALVPKLFFIAVSLSLIRPKLALIRHMTFWAEVDQKMSVPFWFFLVGLVGGVEKVGFAVLYAQEYEVFFHFEGLLFTCPKVLYHQNVVVLCLLGINELVFPAPYHRRRRVVGHAPSGIGDLRVALYGVVALHLVSVYSKKNYL